MADISSFVNQYQGVAQKVGQAIGVDPNVLLGQWGLESGWGKHTVPGTNNLGNIKGAGVAATDNQTGSTDQYRKYQNADSFGNDFARLIATHYSDATDTGDDAMAYAVALKKGGYAEDPHYVPKLTAAVDTVKQAGGAIDPGKVQWDDGGSSSPTQPIDPNQIKWDDQATAPVAKTATPAQQVATTATPKPMSAREKAAQLLTNSPLDQFTSGITHGVTNTVGGAIQHGAHGLGWLLNKAGYPQADQAVTGAGDAAAQFLTQGTPNTPAGMAGQIVGGAGLPAPGGGGILRTIGAAGTLGALQPVQPGENFGQQTVKNALVGGAAGGLGTIASRLVGGAANPEARALMDAGVNVTPGQGMGGLARDTEEALKSVPVLGSAIKSAERSNIASYNRMLYQDALAPIGATLPRDTAVGSDAVAAVRNTIGDRFNSLARQASFTESPQFARDVAAIRQDLATRAPDKVDQFNSALADHINDKLVTNTVHQGPGQQIYGPNGQVTTVYNNPVTSRTMTGAQWNDSRSALSGLARDNRLGNTTPSDRALADALDDLGEAMNHQVIRQAPNPQFQQELTNANNAYARYKRIETAAGTGGASNASNVFSPAQYANAVRQGSTKFQRATNSGLNADVAARAQQVLGSKVPDSGTVGRGLIGAAALGGLGAVNPTAAAGVLGSSALYATPAGRRLMSLLLLQRPELLQRLGGAGAAIAPGAGVLAPQIGLPQGQ